MTILFQEHIRNEVEMQEEHGGTMWNNTSVRGNVNLWIPDRWRGHRGHPMQKDLSDHTLALFAINVLRTFFCAGTGQQLEIRVLNRRRPVELTVAVDIL